MRLLTTVLLFVLAMSAEQAQWQTKVRVEVSPDQTLRGYKEFSLALKNKIEAWGREEVAQGTKSAICGKVMRVEIRPHGLYPEKNDVQVWIVWENSPTPIQLKRPGTLNLGDGVDLAFTLIKMAMIETPTTPVLSPSSKTSH